ncbi:MAG: hypothetical protein JWP09_292 [Candidatus Taylorbacteria bacterium]|nr:hypothetical protein [Candidatus Taylorbacteria bacterium]
MPIIPKSSKVKFVLIVLFLLIIGSGFYFKARDARAPIVVSIPVAEDDSNASYLDGQMEDGVLFDDSNVSTSTATSTTATTTKGSKNTKELATTTTTTTTKTGI